MFLEVTRRIIFVIRKMAPGTGSLVRVIEGWWVGSMCGRKQVQVTHETRISFSERAPRYLQPCFLLEKKKKVLRTLQKYSRKLAQENPSECIQTFWYAPFSPFKKQREEKQMVWGYKCLNLHPSLNGNSSTELCSKNTCFKENNCVSCCY